MTAYRNVDDQETKAYLNVEDTASTTSSKYLNVPASSEPSTDIGISNGPRSGAPFAGMYDADNNNKYQNVASSKYQNVDENKVEGNTYQHGPKDTYQHGPKKTYQNVSNTNYANVEDEADEIDYDDWGSKYETKPMLEKYRGEHKNAAFRGDGSFWSEQIAEDNPNAPAPNITKVRTHYMNAEEQKAAEIGVANGKLIDSQGNAIDTSKASGKGTYGGAEENAGKHIFAMNGEGNFRQVDPWANKRIENGAGPGGGDTAALTNHSTLLGGKGAAGAGEMRVEKGELQQLTDKSGHYRPDSKRMHQTVSELKEKGVNMDKTSVRFEAKDRPENKYLNSNVETEIAPVPVDRGYADPDADETKKNLKIDTTPLFCSPTELLNHKPEEAEFEIRDEREKLKSLITEQVEKRRAHRLAQDSNYMAEEKVQEFDKSDDGTVRPKLGYKG